LGAGRRANELRASARTAASVPELRKPGRETAEGRTASGKGPGPKPRNSEVYRVYGETVRV
jgi:hypothetical protein